MNDNHNTDKELLEHIEAVVHEGQASPNDLVNALVGSKPQAEVAFQHNLEEQLITRLEQETQQTKGETPMPILDNKPKRKSKQRSRLPFTLAAAVLAIVLVGGLILFTQGQGSSGQYATDDCAYDGNTERHTVREGDTLTSIATFYNTTPSLIAAANCLSLRLLTPGQVLQVPVPSNPVQVVIAQESIPAWETIDHDMLRIVTYSADDIDIDQTFTMVDMVIGRRASVTIASGEIIRQGMFASGDVLATATALAQDTPPRPQASVDAEPFALTATALVQNITATAQSDSIQATVDPFLATATQLALNATEIARQATVQAASAQNSASLPDNPIPTATPQTLVDDTPENARIGIVIGHLGEERGLINICEDSLNELDLNIEIGEQVSQELTALGYTVEILGQFDEALQDYQANAVIELHIAGCSEDSRSGYDTEINDAPSATAFEQCFIENYHTTTGLAYDDGLHSTSDYFTLDDVAANTPTLVTTLGFLEADRELLVDNQDRVITGIVDSITCFIAVPLEANLALENLIPVVVASRDIELNEVITEDMVSVVYWSLELSTQIQPLTDSFMRLLGSPEMVIGQQAQNLIPAYQPILSTDIGDEECCFALDTTEDNRPQEDLLAFVIARRDIELNDIITEDMVTTIYYENVEDAWALADANGGVFYWSSAEQVIGQQASSYIREFEPLTTANISDPQACGDNCAAILPNDTVAIALVTDDPTVLSMPIGSRVDVLIAFQSIEINDSIQISPNVNNFPSGSLTEIILDRTIRDALIVYTETEDDEITAVLAMYPQDATILTYLLDAGVPNRIVPHVEGTSEVSSNASQPYIDDTVALAIHISALDSISLPFEVVTGDSVNLVIEDANEETSFTLEDLEVRYIGVDRDVPTSDERLYYLNGERTGEIVILNMTIAEASILFMETNPYSIFTFEPTNSN